jgi:hypothetical protein
MKNGQKLKLGDAHVTPRNMQEVQASPTRARLKKIGKRTSQTRTKGYRQEATTAKPKLVRT